MGARHAVAQRPPGHAGRQPSLGGRRCRRAAGRGRDPSRGSAPTAALPARLHARVEAEHDLGGALVTPGLVDCHTHLVYGGAARARVRAAPAGRQLRGDRARRRRHPLDRGGHARGQRRRSCSRGAATARSTLMAEGVTTLEIKSGYGLSARARGALPARRAPPRPRTAADGAHDLPGGARRCRRSSRAAPTTTSTPSAPGCRRCTPRAWSTRSMPSASASPSRRRRRGACSTPRGRSACRSSCMPSS